jgi:hypothetical protein
MSSPQPSSQPSSQEPPGTLIPVVAAWLVPGAGHLMLKRPWPALFVASAVLPLFVLGMYLTGWENGSWERHPYYFGLQAPAGLVALVGEFLTRGIVPDRLMPHAAVGTLYSGVAGLLNLMAIADVWARTKRGDPVEKGVDAQDVVQAGSQEGGGA